MAVALGILVAAALAYFGYKMINSNKDVVEAQLTPEQKVIMDKEYEAKDTVKSDELDSSLEVYTMMHEMANTKIIAEDGQVWGLKPITKTRVESVQKAVKDLNIKDNKIDEMLDMWSKQDYSQCVSQHNYLWSKYLNGNIGKAVKLR